MLRSKLSGELHLESRKACTKKIREKLQIALMSHWVHNNLTRKWRRLSHLGKVLKAMKNSSKAPGIALKSLSLPKVAWKVGLVSTESQLCTAWVIAANNRPAQKWLSFSARIFKTFREINNLALPFKSYRILIQVGNYLNFSPSLVWKLFGKTCFTFENFKYTGVQNKLCGTFGVESRNLSNDALWFYGVVFIAFCIAFVLHVLPHQFQPWLARQQ